MGIEPLARRRRWAGLALLAAATVAWWCTLAPRAIGGPASYVVVSGTSMEPKYHTGDLVVLREQASYRTGEIVGASVDGGHVIHRLYSGSPSAGWRTKGINRLTPDLWFIPERHVMGSAWFMVPQGGAVLRWTAGMTGRAIFAACLAALVVLFPSRRARARARARSQPPALLSVLLLVVAAGAVLVGLTVLDAAQVGIRGSAPVPFTGAQVEPLVLGVGAVAILSLGLPLTAVVALGRRTGWPRRPGDGGTATPAPDRQGLGRGAPGGQPGEAH